MNMIKLILKSGINHIIFTSQSLFATVDLTKTIVHVESSPNNMFTSIDVNHRMEKVYREGITYIESYKLMCKQFLPYFVYNH
ncbi:hypothetical protein [Paucisalibacillus globulus]|uniref:hypothetical protein n=1 Tax=Paucisalibacillus globulus TaxID=351095 RepID=UPI00047AE936|nr:hypothetical protein [Paucisalibacillus globulus]